MIVVEQVRNEVAWGYRDTGWGGGGGPWCSQCSQFGINNHSSPIAKVEFETLTKFRNGVEPIFKINGPLLRECDYYLVLHCRLDMPLEVLPALLECRHNSECSNIFAHDWKSCRVRRQVASPEHDCQSCDNYPLYLDFHCFTPKRPSNPCLFSVYLVYVWTAVKCSE